jgi:hypothetical protein
MKRITFIAAAVLVALAPALAGVWGNASFSRAVPVQAPASAEVVTPAPQSTTRHLEPGDDHGGATSRDARTEPGDDHGGATSSRTSGSDDHSSSSSTSSSTSGSDDHGGHGGHGRDDSNPDDRGGHGSDD